MIQKVYSVHDNKALLWMQPFFALAHGQAIRAFSDEANTRNSAMNRHPTDYTLFCIGEYDDQTGALMSKLPPENLGLAADYLKPDQTAPLFDAVPTPVRLGPDKAPDEKVSEWATRIHDEMLARSRTKNGAATGGNV